MPIPTSIDDLSPTPGDNFPAGSDAPAVIDNVLREHAAYIAQLRDFDAGLATPSGAALVNTQQAFAGAVERSLEAVARDSIHAKDAGMVLDGVTDDYLMMKKFADAGVKQIEFPDGSSCYLATPVSFAAGVKIKGKVTFKHKKDAGALIFAPTPGAAVSVTGITASVNYPAYTSQQSSSLTVSSTAGLVRGGVCLLASTDVYGYGNGVKKAELIRILEIVGSTVYTHGPIQDTYTTSVTLTPLSTESIVLDGPTFECAENAYAASTPYGYIGSVQLVGCVDPVVNVSVRNGLGPGVSLMSCWSANVHATVKDLRDKSASNALGYGVVAYGATANSTIYVDAQRVRHAYTDGDYGGANALYQGVPRRNTVSGVAVNTTAAPWDTHDESHNTFFDGCRAIFGNGDADATGNLKYGFQVRGKNVRIRRPLVRGMSGMFFIFAATWGATNECLIEEPDFEMGTSGADVLFSLSAKTSADRCVVKFIAGRMSGGSPTIGNGAPELEMHGTLLEENPTFRLAENNTVTLWGVTRASVGNISEAVVVGPGTRLDIDDHLVRSKTGFIGGGKIIQTGSTAGTATVRLGRVYSDVALSSSPIVVSQETTTLALTSHQVYPRPVGRGTTAQRPTLYGIADRGTGYLDNTLAANGKPIVWNGAAWVDSTGTVV